MYQNLIYRWTKKGGALPNDRTSYDNYGKTLVIKYVDFTDEGEYTCEASNGVGLAQSHSIQIKVYAKPYFTKEPESQVAAEGETVTFECEAGGYPAPHIKWVHNGKPIEEAPSNPRRKVAPKTFKDGILSPDSITIVGLTKEDTGNYGCNASSDALESYVYKDVFINVISPENMIPNQPKVLWVECNNDDVVVFFESMMLQWYNKRAPILSYKIQYNTTFLPDSWVTATGKL